MRSKILILLISSVIIPLPAFTDTNSLNQSCLVLPETSVIASGNNLFAVELYNKLMGSSGFKQTDNLFFSPYSISTALALTWAGAKNNTEQQMAEVLHFPFPQKRLHKTFGSLQKNLNEKAKAGSFQLNIANALWTQHEFSFLAGFLNTLENDYDAPLHQVDFKNTIKRQAARKTINKWVEEKTNDKIKNLIKPGILSAMTRLVLTNAIYFKGDWAVKFDENKTIAMSFHISPEKKIDADMMSRKDKFLYVEKDDIQILSLPYKDEKLSMLIFLPKDHAVMKKFQSSLTYQQLNKYSNALTKRELLVYLPKFKMTSEFELAKTLSAMGMPDAFGGRADFSAMTGAKDLFISNVLHKAFVEVNEQGTEAAAATGVVMKLTSAAPQRLLVFRADRPFIFTIIDNESESILFMGRLSNPSKASELLHIR